MNLHPDTKLACTDTMLGLIQKPDVTREEKQKLGRVMLDFLEPLEELRRTVPKRECGREILIAVDSFVETHKKINPHEITCKKGCSYCCHISVSLTVPEALVAWEYADASGFAVDTAKLERQAVATDQDQWQKLPREDQSCVFLRDGLCAIYPARPASCRKHFSADDPERCNMDKFAPGSLFARWVSPMAEAFYSAVLNVWKMGLLPRVMLAARKDKA